ncbi:hypothetical protein V1517DRAFT_333420 [Lipomyces orientalis]|uniref:Uncharacterized protein n=1 Tax=Lipomyces orientalis TaxID=1233043 RepID=A0ACC3TE67_9ASCO
MQQTTWQPPAGWQSRPVCVLGGGVLGRRIAACFVAAGYQVRIRDPSAKSRNDAVQYIKDNISAFTTLSGREPGSYYAVEDLPEAVKNCWLVFEVVPEILTIKEDTFFQLESHAPNDCIFASNSSSYKSGDLLSKVRDETKTRVLNTHYMMPPEAIIVELMTSGHTVPDIFPFLVERHKEAGLHPVVALKESTGFIFNRIWAAIKREVLSVLAEGVATPETIDSIWIEQYVGRKVGPCKMMDSVGLDTVEHIEEHYIKERQLPDYHLNWLRDNYISIGKLGLKSAEKGGLYPPPVPGTQTKVLLLNIGLAEPLVNRNMDQIMHSGQVLAYTIENKGSRPVELVGKLPNPDGIDVAKSTKRMYWTNMGNPKSNDGSLQSANLDGTDVQYVLQPGSVHTPKQMVIDQDHNKIYLCDREGMRVMRCNLDGSDHETIYQSGNWETEPEKKANGIYWPVGITLSKRLNKFFWTQKGQSKANEGRIFSASLEMPPGASPATRQDVDIIIDGLPECIDLEFDDEEGVLYWTDRGEIPFGNTLNKKHIIGAPPSEEIKLGRQIIAQGLGEGIGLRLDKANKCLYVADMTGHLWKCSTDYGLKEKLLEGTTHAYTGVCCYKV